MANKVFGIGWGRTGTTTLGKALKMLGYSHYGMNLNFVLDVKRGDFSRIFKVVEQYDCFEDWPWPLIYKELDKKYPNSKFILTTRTPTDRLRSYKKLLAKNKRHLNKKQREIKKFIYGYESPSGHEKEYIERYKSHIEEVLKYFKNRKQDLLVIDWTKGDGWDKLCHFLNKPIPNSPIPHLNKSWSIWEKYIIRAKQLLKRFLCY